MNPAIAALRDKVTDQLIRSIYDHLHLQDFDSEGAEIKLIDRDESCLYLGLYEANCETNKLEPEPSVIWTVEVSAELKGGN